MSNIIRKGFTLIELLIVIVVIAVLSSIMILSSLEATYTAEANNIIVGLVQMKKAFDMWCIDHPDSFDKILTANKIQDVLGDSTIKHNQAPGFWNEVTSYLQKPPEPDPKEKGHYYYTLKSFEFWIGDGNRSGSVQENTGLYVVYAISGKTVEKRKIAAKLAGRAKSVGLLGNKKMSDNNKNPVYDGVSKDSDKYVLYKLL